MEGGSEPVRLLVADDDPVMRMILAAVAGSDAALQLVGEAEDAEQAIRLAAEHRPDVVLLDVDMPGGGGLHAAAEIRARHPAARIVALSGDDSPQAREEMARAGATGYVVKGAPSEEILRAIRGTR